MQPEGPLMLIGAIIVAGFLLLGVNAVSFFGHTCYFVGPIRLDRQTCIPQGMIVVAWLGVVGLLIGGVYKLTTDTSASSQEPNAKRRDDFDRVRWNELVKVDPQLALVAEKLAQLGNKWVDEFARSYMILGDKQYLPNIVNRIIAQAREEEERNAALAEEKSKLNTDAATDRLGRQIGIVFKCRDGWIAGLVHSGNVAFLTHTDFKIYESLEAYRLSSGDYETWIEIKREGERREFIRTVAISLNALARHTGAPT